MSDTSVARSEVTRRPWIRTAALGGVILICGFLIGAGVSGHMLWNRVLHGARSPERMHARITERLMRSLDLTEDQALQIRAIMDEHRRREAEILEQSRPRLEAEIERMRAEVAAVLTPEQAERWNERMEQFRRRWIDPPPWRDRGGRRPPPQPGPGGLPAGRPRQARGGHPDQEGGIMPMRIRTRPGARIVPGVPLAVLWAVLAASVGWVTGCNESGGPGRDLVAESAAADGATLAAAYVPTLAQVQGRIELRAEQIAAVSVALEELRSQATELGRARQEGKRPGRSGDAKGDGPAWGEHPCLRFIERCAGTLDPDQLAALLAMLSEGREQMRQERGQREQRRAQNRPGRGERGDEHGDERPARQIEQRLSELTDLLELTAEQRAALEVAMREQREALRGTRPETPGAGRSTEAMERREAIREAFAAKLAAILTPAQNERLAAHRAEQREQRLERHAEHRARMQERMIQLLTAALHLEPAQVEAVTRILTDAHDRAEAVHEAARGGQSAPADVRAQLDQIRDESREAIAAELTDEQRTVFEALLPWLPHPPPAGPPRG